MRTLIKIAWRNIWRNTSRSVILILAIVFGLLGGNFIVSIYLGLIQQNFRDTIERQISHIQIHDPDFVKDNEAQYRIADGLQIVDEIHRHPDVKSATARTVMHGMAASPLLSTGIRIVGVYIGMKKIKVFGMVIIETVLLSLTGGVIGLVLSFGLVKFLQQRGVDLSAIGGENLREVGFPHFVYPELALAFYFQVAVLVVFFAVLASIYPAIKAIKLVPAEAVRQE